MNDPDEKNLSKMTTDEVVDFLFPKRAVEALKTTANPDDKGLDDIEEDDNGDS